jgi:hypothetical protein
LQCLPIGSGTGQHFIDANNVEWMQSHSDVELIFSAELHQVLVAANTASFQSFGAELFIFIRHEMNAEWEVIDVSPLSAQIENANLGVWNTTAETRFGVWFVFTVAVAKRRKKHCFTNDPVRILKRM